MEQTLLTPNHLYVIEGQVPLIVMNGRRLHDIKSGTPFRMRQGKGACAPTRGIIRFPWGIAGKN